jgi:hypothetical protein
MDVLALAPSYLAFGVLKHAVSLPRLATWVWHDGHAGDLDTRVLRVVRAVVRLSRRLPLGDRDCLQRSLVLYRELSRAGAAPTLVLGFEKGNDGVKGHAWVDIVGGGRSVLPEDVSSFVTTVRFGAGCRLSTDAAPARRA